MENALIVDDIPEYVDTLEAYVEDRLNVLKAHTTEEARNLLEEKKVALGIVDIRLDENDPENREGLDLLKWIRENHSEMKVIVMSAYKEFDYAVEALNTGADYFMRKPIDPEELGSILDKLL